MQLTETIALTDLTAVTSIAIAAVVAVTGYRNTKHSARQTFDNFTLRFIETENADPHLHEARQWLAQACGPIPIWQITQTSGNTSGGTIFQTTSTSAAAPTAA